MDGAAAIEEFLKNISTETTGILCIPTLRLTSGDLDSHEIAVINHYATYIGRFVAGTGTGGRGGGLFAMGEIGEGAWKWLQTLIPGMVVKDLGDEGQSSPPVISP